MFLVNPLDARLGRSGDGRVDVLAHVDQRLETPRLEVHDVDFVAQSRDQRAVLGPVEPQVQHAVHHVQRFLVGLALKGLPESHAPVPAGADGGLVLAGVLEQVHWPLVAREPVSR